MEISYHTHFGGLDITQGYGVAGYHIVDSLKKLGHTTPFNNPTSKVGFNFTQPYYYQYHPGQYIIGYTPWESSKLQDNWNNLMNECDEVWTTSDLCKKWFEADGVTKDVFVFEHGIDHIWAPSRRVSTKQLRFLHVGEPAPRKGGQQVLDAFIEVFGSDPRYQLTFKTNGMNTVRAKYPDQSIVSPEILYPNVRLINGLVEDNELVSIYYSHHVLVYPSWGEGFGFIPIQAMASGMPVIFNTSWAPYRRFSVGLDVKDRLVDSVQPWDHPGMQFEPDFESLKLQMQRAADDYETFAEQAFAFAPQIHEEYDWTRLTENAFQHIVEKFS